MKKTKYILTTLLAAAFLAGCVDLNYNEGATQDEAWTYENPKSGVSGMIWEVYSEIFNELQLSTGSWGGALRASVTDEAQFATSTTDLLRYIDGGWTPSNAFPDIWQTSYRAISEAHLYLEKIDKVDLSPYRFDADYENLLRQYELFPYELRFLRAYFYFELARAYGDVPLVTTTLTYAQANAVTRTPVKEIFKFIVEECDAIAEYLPYSYVNEPGAEIGRATRAAVLGLKARTLLYAASPLFNTEGNKELWKEAAVAAKELIDRAADWGITLSAYKDLWGNNAFYASEMIMPLGIAQANDFERANYPVGIEGGSSGNCPSQSLVDAYEYQDNGETFGQRHPGSITITAENDPYAGLDPRFALTVVKNGDSWPLNAQAMTIETWTGGMNALPKYAGTPTGYYLRKFVNGDTSTTYNNPTSFRHTTIAMRLAEVYLNYAEAMYNYYGDADAQGDLGMSANEAVNVLRTRKDIKMPEFAGSEGWIERYQRERMVELAFEGHRFWDVRRWKKGAEFFGSVGTATLTKSGDQITLSRGSQARVWDEKYNLYPIPQSEMLKNNNLVQNPGW
jgi:hypothetical protein